MESIEGSERSSVWRSVSRSVGDVGLGVRLEEKVECFVEAGGVEPGVGVGERETGGDVGRILFLL